MSLRTSRLLAALGLIGTSAFLYGILFGHALRAWQTLLVNFLFFGGLAQAGIVLSALFQTTSASWARSLKRAAEATVAFLPVSFLLLLVLFLGIPTWAPWVDHPNSRDTWLNVPFFVAREATAFLTLGIISVAYVYHSLRPDIGMLHESGQRQASGLAYRLIKDWRGISREQTRGQRFQNILAPTVLIAYGWIFSLIAFDFVMALDRHWYSSLAGGYFFTGNILSGVAFLTLVAVWGRDRLHLHDYIGHGQIHDIGKLLFGFCILWAYMLWSQYLVIWYGDLPEEIQFVSHRMQGSWAPVTWLACGLIFLVPFIVLLSRQVKSHAPSLVVIASAILVGIWLERFVLVSPSLWRGDQVPLGFLELLITSGTFSLFVLCYAMFVHTFPLLAVSDPRLNKVT